MPNEHDRKYQTFCQLQVARNAVVKAVRAGSTRQELDALLKAEATAEQAFNEAMKEGAK